MNQSWPVAFETFLCLTIDALGIILFVNTTSHSLAYLWLEFNKVFRTMKCFCAMNSTCLRFQSINAPFHVLLFTVVKFHRLSLLFYDRENASMSKNNTAKSWTNFSSFLQIEIYLRFILFHQWSHAWWHLHSFCAQLSDVTFNNRQKFPIPTMGDQGKSSSF